MKLVPGNDEYSPVEDENEDEGHEEGGARREDLVRNVLTHLNTW